MHWTILLLEQSVLITQLWEALYRITFSLYVSTNSVAYAYLRSFPACFSSFQESNVPYMRSLQRKCHLCPVARVLDMFLLHILACHYVSFQVISVSIGRFWEYISKYKRIVVETRDYSKIVRASRYKNVLSLVNKVEGAQLVPNWNVSSLNAINRNFLQPAKLWDCYVSRFHAL